MNAKRRGLGRGLDALLAGGATTANPEAPQAAAASEKMRELAVHAIQRGKYQPRSHFDEHALRELADSITAQGLVQPVVVRPVGQDADGEPMYELIAGERRWRAAQMAGLQEIPAVIREVADEAAIAMSLIENIQREDLNTLEEAQALQRLQSEFELTHQEVATAVGRSRTAVTNLLRLLDLNDDLKTFVEQGKLDMGHARALLALKGPQQSELGHIVVRRELTVRQTEQLVRQTLQDGDNAVQPTSKADPDVLRLQNELADKLGAKVQIKQERGGKGKLTINYLSHEELDGILARIR